MGHVCVSLAHIPLVAHEQSSSQVADLDLGPVKFSMSSMSCGSTNDCNHFHYNISIHSGDRKVDKKLISRRTWTFNFNDNIVHVPQNTRNSRINYATGRRSGSQALKRREER